MHPMCDTNYKHKLTEFFGRFSFDPLLLRVSLPIYFTVSYINIEQRVAAKSRTINVPVVFSIFSTTVGRVNCLVFEKIRLNETNKTNSATTKLKKDGEHKT